MKASDFIAWLVQRAGGTLAVAKRMRQPGFQPTLHKICAGQVASPTRASAERIASHFNIPVDAIYSDETATALFQKMSGDEGSGSASASAPVDAPSQWPHERFPELYWAMLDAAERAIVEEAMLDAYDKVMARREQLRASRKRLKPAA
jgi:hypothetical protein